jgi:hypothetical protein
MSTHRGLQLHEWNSNSDNVADCTTLFFTGVTSNFR